MKAQVAGTQKAPIVATYIHSKESSLTHQDLRKTPTLFQSLTLAWRMPLYPNWQPLEIHKYMFDGSSADMGTAEAAAAFTSLHSL